MHTGSKGRDKWLLVIGSAKLIKGLLLLVAAIGALKLLHADIAAELNRWIQRLNVDPENRFLQTLVGKVDGFNAHRLAIVGAGSFCYSALFLTEGIGLLWRKRWAEYLTVIATTSFVPLEIYELVKRVDVFRLLLLLVNVVIVVYLVWRLVCRKSHPRSKAGS